MRATWVPMGRRVVRAAATMLLVGLTSGCGGGKGTKPAGAAAAPPDSPTALRQDVDRLRTDLAELRTRLETLQRAGAEYSDRTALETRSEFDAVRQAMEASSRHEIQRQVEVLDAQTRRIDLLEKRVADLSQGLRRVELSLTAVESQLGRALDPSSGSAGARAGAPVRAPGTPAPAPAPRVVEDAPPPSAAGAGLTPPAMLGPSRSVKSAAPPTPGEAPLETKTTSTSRSTPSTPGDPPRVAKSSPETKAPVPERPPGAPLPATPAKPAVPASPPAGGGLTARALFDRGMQSWQKGEQGQAVLDFEELVHAFPSDPLAASAQFRIGEAYYAARDFDRAAVEYRKAVDLAPKGKDAPQALLRLGLAYRAQKRESDARQAWNQLVRDFPESDASEEARRALRGR